MNALVILFSLTLLSACAPAPWAEGSTHGAWQVIYTGYGSVTESDGVITLSPRSAREPAVTHAGLVATTAVSGSEISTTIATRTTRQLRQPEPNPWEVGWVLWHYTDDEHFYYVALKPNGWEIGKEDPAYPGAQRFLVTGTKAFPLGLWHEVTIRQSGATFVVVANGESLATFTDTERPYTAGRVALYTEDATVEFRPGVLP